MGRWKIFGTKSNYYVKARNVVTGRIIKLPMATRDEANRFKWYPHTDYVPLKIKKRK